MLEKTIKTKSSKHDIEVSESIQKDKKIIKSSMFDVPRIWKKHVATSILSAS